MMKYRKDIDGLRALAIVPVVLYHAFPQHLTGGFVGVDIFFIISGFLISTIIFTDIKNNSFSFLTFYTRRIKRIFPALILLFIFLIVFGYFYLFNTEYGTLSRHISSGALFYSNFKLLGEAGYWDIDSIQKPLLQLWSLGVEEQFYIVFPILMIGVAKLKDKIRLNLVAILISLIIISFGLNIYFVYENQPLAFYSPFTRMWELLMGSVLAYYTLENKIQNTKILSNNYVSLLGLLLIVVSILSLKEKIAYPGFYALLPTLGAVFIISTGENSFVNKYLSEFHRLGLDNFI